MKKEKAIKLEVKEFLNSLGDECWYYMPVPMGYGRKGIPDFIGIFRGKGFTIETKTSKNGMSPWQEREYKAILDAQGQAFTNIYDVEIFKKRFMARWGIAYIKVADFV